MLDAKDVKVMTLVVDAAYWMLIATCVWQVFIDFIQHVY